MPKLKTGVQLTCIWLDICLRYASDVNCWQDRMPIKYEAEAREASKLLGFISLMAVSY